VREIWRCTKVVWNQFRSAILPLSFRNMGTAIERFLEHLARTTERYRARWCEVFLKELGLQAG